MQQACLDRILGILCSVMDAHTAVLFSPLSDEAGDCPHGIVAMFSLSDRINRQARIYPGQGLVGWIIRNQEPLLVPKFDQRQNHLGYYNGNEDQEIKAFMGCSLPGDGGALCVDSKRQYYFSEKDQKMLHLFADLIVHLRRREAQEESLAGVRRHYAALRAIYTLRREHSRWADFLRSFLILVAEAAGFSYGALYTLVPDGSGYVLEGDNTGAPQGDPMVHPLSAGMAGWVFKNSAPVFSGGPGAAPTAPVAGGASPIFQTSMLLPLVIQRKTRGVFCLGSGVPLEMNDEVRDFARMASEHLALFLENLYVKCRLRDLHRQGGAGPVS